MTTRAVIYTRVSTVEQGNGYSLQTQEERCRSYCADHGYEVVGAFPDMHSGTELDRPGLNDAIAAVNALRPDVVVLFDVDRLGREIIVQAIAERDLTRHGARVEYVLGGNSADAGGELLKTVKGAIAVYENRQRVERSKRGKDGRVRAGHPLVGPRPPYGYGYTGGDRTGNLVPREDEAAVVRQMFGWIADDGLSAHAVAQRLHAQGIPTRADEAGSIVTKRRGRCAWHPSTVAGIVRRETYLGTWHYGKSRLVPREDGEAGKAQRRRPREEWVAVAVPPLVDRATWERAQERLSHPTRPPQPTGRDYLLSGRIFCACGGHWTGRGRNDRGTAFYRCTADAGSAWERPCPMRFGIRQERLEGAVLGAVKAFLLDADTRRAALGAERARAAEARERAEADLETIDAALAKSDRQMAKLLDSALAEDFPPDLIADRKRALVAERQRLAADREQRLAALAPGVVDVEAAIADLAPTVEAAFAKADPAELRKLLDILRVEIHPIDRDTVRLTGVIGSVVSVLSAQKRHEAPITFALPVSLPPQERKRRAA